MDRTSNQILNHGFRRCLRAYANSVKPAARRLLEIFILIHAVSMLCLMIYLHITWVKNSGHCLDHIKSIWPKHGVLKVQVKSDTSLPPYPFYFAKANQEALATSYQGVAKYSVELWKDGVVNLTKTQMTPNTLDKLARQDVFGIKVSKASQSQFQGEKTRNMSIEMFSDVDPIKEEEIPQRALIGSSISDTVKEIEVLHLVDKLIVNPQPVREYYAIEYSAEFGYLQLSAVTRYELGIPVMVVTLDPERDACFGTGMAHWMLKTFFGYDDLLVRSIMNLTEETKGSRGFLRNLVTGKLFKFTTMWVGPSSYLLFFTMVLILTLASTMQIRYLGHHLSAFMDERSINPAVAFPAAPMLFVWSVIGVLEIARKFFHNSKVAVVVFSGMTLLVAQYFSGLCMSTVISRRHCLRFFVLYHWASCAYYYHYDGPFSKLAFSTSWLFIQHSVLYFFHHHEIPAITR